MRRKVSRSNHLGELEQLVLMALIRCRGNAYGVTIRREIRQRTGRDVRVGPLYNVLERLERKGFATSRWGEPTPERGGRAKRYFEITASGLHALEISLAAIDQMRPAAGPAPALSGLLGRVQAALGVRRALVPQRAG